MDELWWDENCGINLANYITRRKDRIGIPAKGCDSRNMVTHIVENQISREQLHIVGIPCTGMIDRRKIALAVEGRQIQEVSMENNQITVSCDGSKETLSKADYLQENCAICIHRNPVIYDELVAEQVEEQTGVDRYEDIRAREEMSSDERWDYFAELVKPCIRCNACRNACPQCYCPVCFVDESRPQWVGKSVDPTDTMTFHVLRAFHLAGRCTDCGACERACPVGIKVRQLTKKMEKDVFELYGWETGLTTESRPPLDVYRPEDPDDFIK